MKLSEQLTAPVRKLILINSEIAFAPVSKIIFLGPSIWRFTQFKIRLIVQVQQVDKIVFQLVSKLLINLVAREMMNFFVTPKIKLKSIVDRIMVQIWSLQQVGKEQSGHQIDATAWRLHVNHQFGIRFPIAEVFMIFLFLFLNFFSAEPGEAWRGEHCTLDFTSVSEDKVVEEIIEETLPCGIHEVCDLFFNRDNSSRSNFGFSLTLLACVLPLFF